MPVIAVSKTSLLLQASVQHKWPRRVFFRVSELRHQVSRIPFLLLIRLSFFLRHALFFFLSFSSHVGRRASFPAIPGKISGLAGRRRRKREKDWRHSQHANRGKDDD